MTEELKQHIRENEAIFKTWLDIGEAVNIGQGQIQPLIPEFTKRFPEVNLTGNCKSCIHDMLLWALNGIKTETNGKKKNSSRTGSGE
jgi:hypothetical protein